MMMNDNVYTNSTYYDKIFEELEMIKSIVKTTKTTCLELELNGQYYGSKGENSVRLIAERNTYINMLTMLTDKIQSLINLNCAAEAEFFLQKNSDNSR